MEETQVSGKLRWTIAAALFAVWPAASWASGVPAARRLPEAFRLAPASVEAGVFSLNVANRRDNRDSAKPEASTSGWVLSAAGAAGPPAAPPSETSEVRPRKPRGRGWLELGGFMTYSAVSYWIKYTKKGFIEDWQFKLNWHDQSHRFFTLQAWAFDSNNFKLNWTHTLAGGVYYQFARCNNFSWPAASLVALAGSFFWEYVVEWKEVIAINDQIMTGLGGYATGEPWYQIGRFLNHQRNPVLQALGFLNPIYEGNAWLDRHNPALRDYEPPGWHDLAVFAGARRLAAAPGRETQTGVYFGFRARLLGLPEYGAPDDIRRSAKDTYFSEISLDYTVRDGRADETNFITKAVALGWLRQDIGPGRTGYSLTLGLGSAFQYFKKRPTAPYDANPVAVTPEDPGSNLDLSVPRSFTDKLAALHIAGPVLDWTLFRKDFTLRTTAEAYLDFALVNSFALNRYSELHDILGMKTTVLYYGYYYGFGGTAAGSFDLAWHGFRARGRASFGAWGSADFRDRFQYDVTNNAHLSDTRFDYLVGAGWKIPGLPAEAFVRYEGLARWGRVQDVSVHGLEKRLFAGLEFFY